jgi:endonuclease/exonuclease/phosphatase family metal-dependent hydrolase
LPIGRLRVATFNVQHGLTPDGRVDMEAFGRACAALDADVLALQEVDDGVPRTSSVDMAGLAATATGLHATFGRAMRYKGGEYGNALLTRTPPSDVEVVKLPGRGRSEPRSALFARVDDVTVVVTHLSVARHLHVPQVRVLAAALREHPQPQLVMGDFNHPNPDLPGFTFAGGGRTWPARLPMRRLDHIAVDGLEIDAVDIVELGVSDHRAVVATLH